MSSASSSSAAASDDSRGAALAAALAAESAEFSAQHPNDARLAHKGHVRDIDIRDVTVTLPTGQELLNLARIQLREGGRYGLIGKNGIGKSVLLRRMATGRIGGWPAHLKAHLVEQEVAGSEMSALEVVIASDTQRTALLAREKALLQSVSDHTATGTASKPAAATKASTAAETELADVYEQLAAIDSDGAEARAAEILDDLQFTQEMQAQPTKSMSGGWRMRVSLACALFAQPDVLLLDEPTNHLDLHGVLWLTEYLNSLSCTVLVVSHDSAFLDSVTTDIIHFKDCTLHYFSGSFDTYLNTKSESAKNIMRQQEALDSKRAHISASIDKMKSQAKKSGHSEMKLGGVGSRQKKLGRMGLEKTADGKKFNAQLHGIRLGAQNASGMTTAGSKDRREAISLVEPPEPGFRFSFPAPDMDSFSEGAPLITMKDVSFGFGENGEEVDMDAVRAEAREFAASCQRAVMNAEPAPLPANASSPLLLANIDLTIRPGAKIGLVGANGAGKSTLLSLLGGVLQPSSGEVVLQSGVKTAFFAQHLVEQLDIRLTPVQHILSLPVSEAQAMASGPNPEQAARTVLGRFGLAGPLALTPIGTLSGGQKARVLFASITLAHPHILLLDEPTNHLDLVTSQALLDAITSFQGVCIWVSHDQQLMRASNELWLVEKRVAVKPPKLNPNQLAAAATKAKKEAAAAAAAAAKKSKSGASSSSSAAPPEKLSFPSRCIMRKLAMSFDEYRDSIVQDLA